MENTIYVIHDLHRMSILPAGEYWTDIYVFDGIGSYVRIHAPAKHKTLSEAILKYDISGKTEPLYDNTGTDEIKLYVSPEEIRRMKRIR